MSNHREPSNSEILAAINSLQCHVDAKFAAQDAKFAAQDIRFAALSSDVAELSSQLDAHVAALQEAIGMHVATPNAHNR